MGLVSVLGSTPATRWSGPSRSLNRMRSETQIVSRASCTTSRTVLFAGPSGPFLAFRLAHSQSLNVYLQPTNPQSEKPYEVSDEPRSPFFIILCKGVPRVIHTTIASVWPCSATDRDDH